MRIPDWMSDVGERERAEEEEVIKPFFSLVPSRDSYVRFQLGRLDGAARY